MVSSYSRSGDPCVLDDDACASASSASLPGELLPVYTMAAFRAVIALDARDQLEARDVGQAGSSTRQS